MKIITALDNQDINEKLKKYENYSIIAGDISYQEGIFEVLEKEKDVDIVIIKEKIEGKLLLIDLIDDIKIMNEKIRIIIMLEKENNEIEELLKEKKVESFFFEKLTLERITKIIDKEINTKIKKYSLVQLNEKKQIAVQKEKSFITRIKEKFQVLINKNVKKEIRRGGDAKVISIIGSGGIGKSIFCANISSIIQKKILIIDLDILNNSLHTIFGVKRKSNNIIVKINNNIDLISGVNLLKKNEMYFEKEIIDKMIEKFKNKYDYIFIDTSSECFFDYTQFILKQSDICLFLIEGNLVEIKKARNLLNIYLKNWKIEKEKIKMIINKNNNYSVCKEILIELFNECKIIGTISYDKIFNKIINKNMKKIIYKTKLKREYKNIIKII